MILLMAVRCGPPNQGSVLLKHRASVSRVTFWGMADGNSWLNNWLVSGRTAIR